MKVLVNLHTDNLLYEAYSWSCKLMSLKHGLSNTHSRAHSIQIQLSIGSKWGFDLYHFSVYFDSELPYDKELFRSINFVGLDTFDDSYYIRQDVYNSQDLANVISTIFHSSMNTNFK
tara:strand:+ start:7392 stop:7742 length:351 start_codon:yes stop_codon:yes gene_type:complete